MKYSFVLPAYKAKYFRQAIDSILSQTYTEFELIIVNDASPENIESIVDSYSDKRIKYYVNLDNIGGKELVKQWNHCISLSDSEYVILASDDDIYDPEYLRTMDKLVSKYPNANVFRPRVQLIDNANNIIRVDGYMVEYASMYEFMYMLHNRYITGGVPFYMFKREALLKLGGFYDYPMAWGSDDATAISLSRRHGIISTTEILFSFRMSGDNITSRKNDYKSLANKVVARDLFYGFMKKQLALETPSNNLDFVYYRCINKTLKQSIIKSIYELMCASQLGATFQCFSIIKSFPYIKLKWMLASYMKLIGAAIFYK